MSANPYDQRLFWLAKTVRAAEAHVDAALEKFEISGPQLRAFGLIAGGQTQTIRGLAGALQIDGAAASRLVDKLAGKGFVVREPDPADKRSVLVVATAPGRRILDDIGAAAAEAEQAFFSSLSKKQQKALDSALGAVLITHGIGRVTKTGKLRPPRRKPAETGPSKASAAV